VVQASLFGAPSLATRCEAKHEAAKHRDAKKTNVALVGAAKSNPKPQAAKAKKSGEARLAKKSDNSAKSAAKSKKSSSTSRKDKYSRSHSKRSIMVSEAR